MREDPPLVSIVVPCFNLGPWLEEALDSGWAQTLQDLEVVVVDDGSTDPATRATLEGIDRPGTHLVRSENRGLGPARNLGVERSRGRYLCFLDADDRLLPTYLEKAIARLEAEPALSFVSCWIQAFGAESWEYRPERCDLPTLLAECTVATPAVVRREAFLAVGGFDERMPEQGDEDWDLWIRLVASGRRGAILPEILFEYRRRPGSMVDRCYYGEGHLALMRYLFEKHEALYAEHLDAVLAHQRAEIRELEGRAESLRVRVRECLEPACRERRELRDRLAELVDDRARAVASARAEAAALRGSLSWRITAPLRRVYEWLGGGER